MKIHIPRLTIASLAIGLLQTSFAHATSAPPALSPSADAVGEKQPLQAANPQLRNGTVKLAQVPTPEPTPAPGPDPAPVPAPIGGAVPVPGAAPAPVPVVVAPLPQPPPPTAPLGVPVSVHGSYFSRYELRENYTKLLGAGIQPRFQEGDRAVYRFRTAIATGPVDIGNDKAVVLYFAPQASGFYPGLGTASNSAPTIGESDLGVVEGYLSLQSAAWDLDVGRFIMNYGSSAVIGSLDWHQSARSFQGLRWKLHLPEKAFLDVFLTQQSEGVLAPNGPVPSQSRFAGGDEYFTGVYSGIGPLVPALQVLDFYALAKVWGGRAAAAPMAASVPAAVQATVGSLVKGGAGPLDYIVEGGVQFGKRRVSPLMMAPANRSVFAYNIDAELGLKLGPGLRAAGYGAYVSGEDGTGKLNNWDELYPTTHMFFGLMDIIGIRSNIADAAFRLAYTSPGSMIYKLDVHNFFRPEDASAAMGKQNGYVGSEANLNVIHKIGKGLTLRAMYGVFKPQQDTYGTDDLAHYLEVEMRYDI